jgi:hypothetical protein
MNLGRLPRILSRTGVMSPLPTPHDDDTQLKLFTAKTQALVKLWCNDGCEHRGISERLY